MIVQSLAGACLLAASATADSVIWESGDQIVQLASQGDASAAPNDHPIDTSVGDIAAMLELLKLRYADEEPDVAPVPLFTKEEIDHLSKAVSTGLARATPSQDIIFHVIGARLLSRGAFARRNRVSAGRIFHRDGALNIIFGQIHTPHRKKNVFGRIEEDFYPRNYGSHTTAAKHDVVLLTNDVTRLHESGAGPREDWVAIAIGSTAGGAVADTRPSPATATRTPSERVEAEAAPPPQATPVAARGTSQRADDTPARPPAETRNQRLSMQSETADPPQPKADVEERLRALKRLRDQELISEEAYQSKMKEILQDL